MHNTPTKIYAPIIIYAFLSFKHNAATPINKNAQNACNGLWSMPVAKMMPVQKHNTPKIIFAFILHAFKD